MWPTITKVLEKTGEAAAPSGSWHFYAARWDTDQYIGYGHPTITLSQEEFEGLGEPDKIEMVLRAAVGGGS